MLGGLRSVTIGYRLVVSSVLLAAVSGCAAAQDDPAKDAIRSDASMIINEIETSPAFVRGQLAEAGVNYLRSGIERRGGRVLDYETKSGSEDAGEALGWVDARMTRDAMGGSLNKEQFTATLCLRFEIRWSDATGGSITYDEFVCPE